MYLTVKCRQIIYLFYSIKCTVTLIYIYNICSSLSSQVASITSTWTALRTIPSNHFPHKLDDIITDDLFTDDFPDHSLSYLLPGVLYNNSGKKTCANYNIQH